MPITPWSKRWASSSPLEVKKCPILALLGLFYDSSKPLAAEDLLATWIHCIAHQNQLINISIWRKCNLFMLVWWQNPFFGSKWPKIWDFGGVHPKKSILRALFRAKPEKVPDKLPLFGAVFCQNPGTPLAKSKKRAKMPIFDPFWRPRSSQKVAWSGCFLPIFGQNRPKTPFLGPFWGFLGGFECG